MKPTAVAYRRIALASTDGLHEDQKRRQALDAIKPEIEAWSIDSTCLLRSPGLRLDAGFYNLRVTRAFQTLHQSGMKLERLGNITQRIFIPPRFSRTYMGHAHGIPFLQGRHVVDLKPADLKYVSPTVHRDIDKWIIRKHWVLVARSGTIGRVALAGESWNGWAASEHILRIVPNHHCPAGYLYAFLSSSFGQLQLTAGIYGGTVDELDDEHVRSVLIPLPCDEQQQRTVNHIHQLAMQALQLREEASRLTAEAMAQVTVFLTGSTPPSNPIDAIDPLFALKRERPLFSHDSFHYQTDS